MDEPLPEKLSIRAAAAWLAGMRPVRPQEERINGTLRLERWDDETPADYRTRSEKYAIFLQLVGEDVAKGVIHAEKEYEVIAQ
ncbi:MAG: hypothetical protein LBF51_04855, partial [Zoogloeaceae bacterium]|nr:hypothetical protein [Zoogloeaceae bacterium]